MKIENVEKFIGKKVKVTLVKYFDHEEYIGELDKGGEPSLKNNPTLFYSYGRYFCMNPQSCLFRASHILKIEELGESKA